MTQNQSEESERRARNARLDADEREPATADYLYLPEFPNLRGRQTYTCLRHLARLLEYVSPGYVNAIKSTRACDVCLESGV